MMFWKVILYFSECKNMFYLFIIYKVIYNLMYPEQVRTKDAKTSL